MNYWIALNQSAHQPFPLNDDCTTYILSFLDRASLLAIACTCQAACHYVRAILVEDIRLPNVRSRVPQLTCEYVARHDLGRYVRSFEVTLSSRCLASHSTTLHHIFKAIHGLHKLK